MHKRWRILEPATALPPEAFPGKHPVLATLLANRGITDAFEAESFLNPDFETGIHDPFRFARMADAVARVFAAFEAKEHITVHGDYDADGVTGSTLVITVLRELNTRLHGGEKGATIDHYIPHRDKEGYGLHRNTVDVLRERGTNLLITVDCGIACVDEIALAKTHGIETIVLDHHQFGDTLPDGYLIHPRLPGESYPFEHLAAVGVSWKFACGLLIEARRRGMDISEGWEKWLLDLVSIATVTDMVPLVGENRVLLTYGLKVLNKTRRLGLRTLVDAARSKGELNSESIGFSIGPRINAAGRMDHAELALTLLLAETDEDASRLAFELEQCNRARQKAVEKMMDRAQEMAESQERDSALVFWNSDWSPALVGLVAGRFLERTGKPVIAIGKHGSQWIGSGRSPAVYDITEAIKRAGDGMLTRSGGHVQACGFSFPEDDHAPMLSERLKADAAARLSAEDLIPERLIDAEIVLDEIDWRLVEAVETLEPYGMGNPRPVFVSRQLEIVDSGLVGSTGAHLRFSARSQGGRVQKFIGFKFGSRLEEMKPGTRVDVVYDIGVNEWNGRRDIQCKVVDIAVT